MSKAKEAKKASRKKTEEEDDDDDEDDTEKSSAKKANNVIVGTLGEVKAGGEGEPPSPGAAAAGDKKYAYRDFSQIPEEDFDVDYEIDQEGLLQALEESTTLAAAQTMQQMSPTPYSSPPPPIMRASGWVRSQRFPVKLYALLSQPNLAPVISWMPHGRSWKVHKPRMFETAVLPVFFESDNYHSFNRVINAWSFRRKSSGPDRGSYFHELFLRGKPHLQKYMRRLPRTHKKLSMGKDEEPDFFDLEKSSPLPSLDEAKSALDMRKVQRIRDQLHREARSQMPMQMQSQIPIQMQQAHQMNQMQAHQMQAHQMQAHQMQAHQMQAHQMQSQQMHAQMHSQMQAQQMQAQMQAQMQSQMASPSMFFPNGGMPPHGFPPGYPP